MKTVLIWGIGEDYERILNIIKYEEYKKNLRVIALVAKSSNADSLDDKKIISSRDIKQYQFDYIIVASKKYFNDIKLEAKKIGIAEEYLIKGEVFLLPNFDFLRYIRIYERKITIISDSCYGGYIYHKLGMKFYSPFINLRIPSSDYLKILGNFKYYMQTRIVENNNDLGDSLLQDMLLYPVGLLKDVKICMVHEKSFHEGLKKWNKRVERINWNDMIFFMVILNDEMAKSFSELPLSNKIGFYYKETGLNSIVCLEGYNKIKIRQDMGYHFRNYVHRIFINNYWDEVSDSIDLLNLLNKEKNFFRRNF